MLKWFESCRTSLLFFKNKSQKPQEKFLVIKGSACFRFRDILTDEKYEILTTGEIPQVVETIPGWTHDITNVGRDELVVMLWANEIFDRNKPDTYTCEVRNEKT